MDYIGKLISAYISTVLGLIFLKLVGWFGASALTWGGIFLLGLGPVFVSLLIFFIVFIAALLTAITDDARKVTR